MPFEPSRDTNPSTGNTSRLSSSEAEVHRIGPYELRQQLGEGGMGVVYAAVDLVTEREVAVKVLHPRRSADDQFRQRFLREAKAAALLSGPNIVPVLGMFEEAGIHYLVMEQITGGSLQMLLDRKQPRDIAWIVDIATQIARGLNVAHAAGVIHRDIKPSNILIDQEQRTAYIADFGLATLAHAQDHLTTTGRPMGTPSYMSPEQVKGLATDPRTDLFSLGCVIYALVQGDSPFQSTNIAATTHRIATMDPEPLHTVDTRVPHRLARLVRKLLRKDPDDRFGSALEVEQALAVCLEPDPDATRIDDDLTEVLPRPKSRFWMRVAAVAGLSTVLVSGGVFLNRGETRTQPPPPPVVPTSPLPQTLTVSASSDAMFRSLRPAFQAARPGDEIRILDDGRYEGPFTLDHPVRHRGIRLVAPLHARLHADSVGATSLGTLEIVGVSDVVIDGLIVEGGTEHHAIYVAGDVTGSELRNLTVVQPPLELAYTWANIMLDHECGGTPERPLVIRGCQIATGQFGICAGRMGSADAYGAQQTLIDGNSFVGPGTHIMLNQGARGIRIEHNLFRSGAGIGVKLTGPSASGSITVANNSFYQVSGWLQLEPRRAGAACVARNNLMVSPVGPVWNQSLEDEIGRWQFTGNLVEDLAQTGDSVATPYGATLRDVQLQSHDPENPDFLRPTPTSPAARIESENGLPFYVGARAPVASK